MSYCNLSAVASKCKLDQNTIVRYIKEFNLTIPKDPETNDLCFDANFRVLFCKIAKCLAKEKDQDACAHKIQRIINQRSTPTIADVALEADVSIAAVSKALNNIEGDIRISETTKERILKAADELGYMPNPFASALRTKRSGIVGAIVRDIDDPFLRQLVKQTELICETRGLSLLISNANKESLTAERQLKLMLNQLFDGLLILGDMTNDKNLLDSLSSSRIPVVLMCGRPNQEFSTLLYDDVTGMRLMLDYVRKCGHRHLAFIGVQDHYSVGRRLNALRDYCAEYDLVCPDNMVFDVSRLSDVEKHLQKILKAPDRPTVIICASDHVAQWVMAETLRLGRKIPQDVSIVGYDDIDTGVFPVPLTTIHQPVYRATQTTVDELLRQIDLNCEAGRAEAVSILIEPELIVRESCIKLGASASAD